MRTEIPPPSPDLISAERTYMRAAVLLIPTMMVWSFAHVFMLPKLQQIWKLAGLNNSKVQWLLDGSNALMNQGFIIFAVVILILMLLELRWSAWPRYRRNAIAAVTLLVHTTVLVGITAIGTAVLVAAPLLTKIK